MKSLSEIKSTLALLEVSPKKSRGQNFLFDSGSIQKILKFADVTPKDSVLEIGPGLGAITEDLLRNSGRYIAVELETKFAEFLSSRYPGIQVVNSDVRDVNLSELGYTPECPCVLVSNLPYSVSTDVVLWIIENYKFIASATLLLQREFAERLAAGPGTKDYGSLSVLCRLYADTKLGPMISGRCFLPEAEVESRLIRLTLLDGPRVEARQSELFNRRAFELLVRSAFSKRRKTLLNSLSSSGHFGDKLRVQTLLESNGIDPKRRAEELSLQEYVGLSIAASLPT